jgi:hypothetical protein
VDRLTTAIVHSWNVRDTDQTPTLSRVLRLFLTVMLERGLGLAQARHLIDFNAREIRTYLVERLEGELVRREWLELQDLKAKEWREETLSAKNRLFKFLTSDVLTRLMGLPEHGLDLHRAMDDGTCIFVKLAQSDFLSGDNARAFGALLVSALFEHALRRKGKRHGQQPEPYCLILDEFQNFVSLDIANMLDQVRKFGLYVTLAHQRFGQLDDDITDAVLTNCRVKAVFGGLPTRSARLMAEELFIGELDATKVKAAIYQTKFWPLYHRDRVYTKGRSQASSSSSSDTATTASSISTSSGEAFSGQDWLGAPVHTGHNLTTTRATTAARGTSSAFTESSGYSEAEADIPIFFPVPFQELSSVQYYTHDEQLMELTAALKEQYPRHCFIKIHEENTQPLLVPVVEEVTTFRENAENLHWYKNWQLDKHGALAPAEARRLIEQQEAALLHLIAKRQDGKVIEIARDEQPHDEPDDSLATPIWNRGTTAKNAADRPSSEANTQRGDRRMSRPRRGPETRRG